MQSSRVLVLFLLLLGMGFGQTTSGRLSGTLRLRGASAAPRPDAVRIVLRESSTLKTVQEVRPDAEGRYTLHQVPFAAYTLEAWDGGTLLASRDVSVSSAVPAQADLEPAGAADDGTPALPEKTVSGRPALRPPEPGEHVFFTEEDVRGLLTPSREQAVEAMLTQLSDVVPDEDGRLHARGEDAAIGYIVDGIPLSGNPTRIHSSLFQGDLAKSVDVRTGGISAQYAGGSAVVSVTTKDGFDKPFGARLGGGVASYDTREGEVQASGRIADRAALTLGASQSGNGRYLDPIRDFEAVHDEAEGRHVFGKLSVLPGENAELHLLGGYDATVFQIPNLYTNRFPAQDQQQDIDSYLAGARLDVDLGADMRLGLAGYSRQTNALMTSGGLDKIETPADLQKAGAENERFFLGGKRENAYHGGLAELSLDREMGGRLHRMRLGASGELNLLKESLTFAVTDSNLSGPDGDARWQPYDLQRGGAPLEAEEERDGSAFSVYLQDAFAVGKWTFAPGLRYDTYDLFEREHAVSPRFAAAYALTPKIDLRGSLDYLVTRAPLENILLSSSDKLRPLAGSDQGNTSSKVGSESALALDLGGSYRPFPILEIELDAYGKYIRNFLVKAELGNSGLIFPINLKSGAVAGGHVQAKLREWHRLSGTLSVGSCFSIGLKPEDGSSPIAAGLLLGEEGHNYSHPWFKEEFFPTEHNQIATAVMNMRYRLFRGLGATLGGRFDSGLPFDMMDGNGNGLSPEASKAELKRRGYSDAVIDLLNLESEEPGSPDKSVAPHAVFDAGVDYRLPIAQISLEARAAVLNVFDTDYLYKFESSFGSTHFGRPRTLGVWLALGY